MLQSYAKIKVLDVADLLVCSEGMHTNALTTYSRLSFHLQKSPAT